MKQMRRRSRLINWGILFLVYTVMQVYSSNTTDKSIIVDNKADEVYLSTDKSVLKSTTTTITDTTKPTLNTTEKTNVTTTASTTHAAHRPTYRPKRFNCTAPAIEQFPRPLMGPNIRTHGGLIIHVIVAIFTFLGLAIVCDDYFVSSLDRICEELKLSPDVAGATFMAAGSSAPELATVIIGVFFAKDDIGVSGVIGSAVFNIMFVISVCALCSGTVCHLNWWPLVRDCFFYAVSILVMLFTIFNEYISWYEALIMLIFYVIYCVVLHFNAPLERWAYSLQLPIKLPTKDEQSALVTYKNVPDTTYSQSGQASTSLSKEPSSVPPPQQPDSSGQDYQSYNDPNSSWDPNAAWGDDNKSNAPITNTWNGAQPSAPSTDTWDPNATWDSAQGQQNYGFKAGITSAQGQQNYGFNVGIGDQTDQAENVKQPQQQQQPQKVDGKQLVEAPPEYYKSKDPRVQEISNPLEKPVDGGIFANISWGVVYPIHYMCRLTIPDCRTEKYKNWFAFTFLISMVWISFYSYFMVWMITIIGTTLGVPDTVMGLTFVAAGVSVPDALSSIAVIKEGYGDMAVSNAVGSNVFDILICLGLPWFIQTTMIDPGGHVNVLSKGLTYSTLSLLSTVVFFLLSVHLNGWKLDKRLGILLMIWYLLFITLASLYELNVFGYLHPPECPNINDQ